MNGSAPLSEAMSIPEIVAQWPQTRSVFARHGIDPDGYKALRYESLLATCKVQQLDRGQLLQELQQALA